MLEIENLTKGFGQEKVIQNLNLKVQNGSVFGLVGVNGAGKSTLLRLIAGVYEPKSGSVTLDGMNTWADMQARRRTAFVSDETWYPPAAAIRSMKQFYESFYDFDERAYERILTVFDLPEDRMISGFSKGMKRKTSLLFALCIHARLLLLDEAYDGLEPIARLKFRQLLTGLIEDEHVSVIISSHNLKELEDICDSYGILQDGRILSYGDLLASGQISTNISLLFRKKRRRRISGAWMFFAMSVRDRFII